MITIGGREIRGPLSFDTSAVCVILSIPINDHALIYLIVNRSSNISPQEKEAYKAFLSTANSGTSFRGIKIMHRMNWYTYVAADQGAEEERPSV
jgi:hypothetical protein